METRRVPQRKDSSSVKYLILALSNKRVSDIIAGIFVQKLNPILQSLSEVLEKNKTLEKDVSKILFGGGNLKVVDSQLVRIGMGPKYFTVSFSTQGQF